MRTLRQHRMRLRMLLLNRQCDGLMARVRRTQARQARPANPGYDELSCPWFLGVMGMAMVVLFIDCADAWPTVLAVVQQVRGA
jgi:hypothetical protein